MGRRDLPGGRSGRHGVTSLVAAVVVPVLVVLAGCGNEPAPSVPPISVSSPSHTRTPASVAPTPGGAVFTPCDDGFECASVPVPVDYGNPTGPTIPIAIVRQAARDQAHKAGVLLVNPGGPGGSGIETVENGVVPPQVADRFDVIGFDPRGVGKSQGLRCPVGPDTPYFADPDPSVPADVGATQQAVGRYNTSCGDRYRDLLPHLGTRNVAADMDKIREALGQDKISYLGFSYGTAIGQIYAQMFPQRIRAMVLDGVVDLSKPGLDSAQAVSFENSLRQYAAACADDPSCPVKPDPIAVVDRVRSRLADNPLPVAGTTPLSEGLFEIGLSLPLYSPKNWPTLSRALAAADNGDGRPMRNLANSYFQESNSDAYNAVTCLDNAWPRDTGQVAASAADTERQAPHFSGNVLVSGLTCAGWPAPQQVLTPLVGYSGPPLLIIGTTNDPATPYANSAGLARSLPGSALLTFRGDGHTAYARGNGCVDSQVDRYLLDTALPTTPTC